MAQGLTQDQMRLVLRRAAELERKRKVETPSSAEAEVREIADEVGIEPAAVSEALAEVNAGIIAAPDEKTTLDSLVGPHQVVVERVVPLAPQAAKAAVEAFLGTQLLRLARRHGDRTVWRADSSLWSQARRALDLTRRFELPRDVTVDAFVVGEGSGSRIRLVLGMEASQKKRARGLIWMTLLGAGIGAAGVAIAEPALWDALSVAFGAGTAATGWHQLRVWHRADLATGHEALERFLDRLAHGEPVSGGP